MDLLFRLFMHSLVDFYIYPDRMEPATLAYLNDALELTWTGLYHIISISSDILFQQCTLGRVITNAMFLAVQFQILITAFAILVFWLQTTSSLTISTIQVCVQQMGGEMPGSCACYAIPQQQGSVVTLAFENYLPFTLYIKDLCPTSEVPLKDNELPLRTSCLFLQAEELKMDLESYKRGEKVNILLSCPFLNHLKNLSTLLVAWVGVGSTVFWRCLAGVEQLLCKSFLSPLTPPFFSFSLFWLLLSWSFGQRDKVFVGTFFQACQLLQFQIWDTETKNKNPGNSPPHFLWSLAGLSASPHLSESSHVYFTYNVLGLQLYEREEQGKICLFHLSGGISLTSSFLSNW